MHHPKPNIFYKRHYVPKTNTAPPYTFINNKQHQYNYPTQLLPLKPTTSPNIFHGNITQTAKSTLRSARLTCRSVKVGRRNTGRRGQGRPVQWRHGRRRREVLPRHHRRRGEQRPRRQLTVLCDVSGIGVRRVSSPVFGLKLDVTMFLHLSSNMLAFSRTKPHS